MTTPRGLGAAAALALAAVAGLAWWTARGAAPGGPVRDGAVAGAEPAASEAPPSRWRGSLDVAEAPPPPSPSRGSPYGPDVTATAPSPLPAPSVTPVQAVRAARSAAAATAWDEVPVAHRVHQLGPAAAAARRGLDAARDQLETCFEEEARLLAQRPAPPADGAAPPANGAAPPADGAAPAIDGAAPATGPGVLVLLLESRRDGLDVVDSTVASLGTSTPELVACARHVLRGWPIAAPGVEPGRRYRLKLTLQ